MKKHLLLSSLAMVVVSIFALSTATYAWFVSSRTPTVQQMKIGIVRSDGLLISASGATGTFKSHLPLPEITAADTGNWNETYMATDYKMQPVTPDFNGKAGDINFDGDNMKFRYMSETKPLDANHHEFDGMISDGTGDILTDDKNYFKDYIQFDLFFMATSAQDVFMDGYTTVIESKVDDGLGNLTVTDAGKAMRVAFVNGSVIADGSIDDTNRNIAVYEPNAEDHHAKTFAVANQYANGTLNYFDVPGAADEDALPAYATPASGVNAINNVVNTYKTNKDFETAITAYNLPGGQTAANEKAMGMQLFHAEEGEVIKTTVYIWMEGNDFDCVNEISASDLYIDLGFRGVAHDADATTAAAELLAEVNATLAWNGTIPTTVAPAAITDGAAHTYVLGDLGVTGGATEIVVVSGPADATTGDLVVAAGAYGRVGYKVFTPATVSTKGVYSETAYIMITPVIAVTPLTGAATVAAGGTLTPAITGGSGKYTINITAAPAGTLATVNLTTGAPEIKVPAGLATGTVNVTFTITDNYYENFGGFTTSTAFTIVVTVA